MPLRRLQQSLVVAQSQTRSSSLKTALEKRLFVSEPDYLDNINLLRIWADVAHETNVGNIINSHSHIGRSLDGVATSNGKSKLIVCHDFQGGYTEDPFERGYSFEFWHLIDTFIYFSHNRITIPPRGWIDAGHRHGCRVLGTVIFEWAESKPDLETCLYDTVNGNKNAALDTDPDASTFPFATTYASHLITLAQARNIDGYLLNIETDLNFLPPAPFYPGKSQKERDEDAAFLAQEKILAGLGALIDPEVRQRRARRMEQNVRVLLGWVGWLREEGKRRIGPHWEIIWYDSVTTAGQLQWQDALTPANAPFFVNSDAIFTNYTWARPPDPAPPGALKESPRPQSQRHPALFQSTRMAESLNRPSSDVYMGIDVWGRNCYGGFDVGRSLEMVFSSKGTGQPELESPVQGRDEMNPDPDLSVALFAPGWTWEREKKDGDEHTWNKWWTDERRFWVGGVEPNQERPASDDSPIRSFFGPRARSIHTLLIPETSQTASPIGPITENKWYREAYTLSHVKAFWTNFNLGSGKAWWVHGQKVYAPPSANGENSAEKDGWTDIGSCFPKPDRIWPSPVLLQFENGGDVQGIQDSTRLLNRITHGGRITVEASLTGNEVWEGGTSLEIMLHNLPHLASDTPEGSPAQSFSALLPLCTLHACHVGAGETTMAYSLSTVVKPLSLPTGSTDFRNLQAQPCLLWTSSEVGNEGSYRLAHPVSSQMDVNELVNGWYSIGTVVQLDGLAMNSPVLTDLVPVFALGFNLPHMGSTSPELKLIIGEISSLPTSPSFHHTPEYPSGFERNSQSQSLSQTPHALKWKPLPRPVQASSTSLWGILTWSALVHEGEHDPINDLLGYFNIFASVSSAEALSDHPNASATHSVWLGTSTYESDSKSFVVAGLEPSDLIRGLDPSEEENDSHTSSQPGSVDSRAGDVKLPSNLPSTLRFWVQWVGSQSNERVDLPGKRLDYNRVEVRWEN